MESARKDSDQHDEWGEKLMNGDITPEEYVEYHNRRIKEQSLKHMMDEPPGQAHEHI